MDLVDGFYEICGHIDCMHFIEENDAAAHCAIHWPAQWVNSCADCARDKQHQLADYIHLDDGEKEHTHDAIPSGIIHTLTEWSKIWPELFRKYPDGKIGPNSSQFEV